MNLDPHPNLSHEGGDGLPKRQSVSYLYLLVGASHAARTCSKLQRAGVAGWKNMKQKVPHLVDTVNEAMEGMSDNTTVIFQLLDTSYFFTKTEEGGLVPARRTTDCVFHCGWGACPSTQ